MIQLDENRLQTIITCAVQTGVRNALLNLFMHEKIKWRFVVEDQPANQSCIVPSTTHMITVISGREVGE